MKKTHDLALTAVLSALCIVLLYISCVLPTMQLTVIAIAGIVSAVLLIECGAGRATMLFAGVSILSVLILPDKSSAVFYALFFGHYPIVKYLAERIKNSVLCWGVKIVFGNICLGLIVLLLRLFFPEWTFPYSLWIIWALCMLVFVLFDLALTRLLLYYQYKIRPKIFRS